MRTLIYILMGIFTFLIQADVLPMLFRQGWIPNLILVWVIVLSLLKGRRIGLMAAITGGLVHDILISNSFGLHLFPYIAVAYIVSIWSFSVYEEQWYNTFAWVSVGTLADIIFRIGMLWLGREDILVGSYLWHHIWPVWWLNGLLGIMIHEILWNMEEKDEYIW